MPPQNERQVLKGIESLVHAILPAGASQDRIEDAFRLARGILEQEGGHTDSNSIVHSVEPNSHWDSFGHQSRWRLDQKGSNSKPQP